MGDTLNAKLAQMVMVGFRGAEPDECRAFLDSLAECPIAGVWLTDNKSPMGLTHGNIRSPEQVRRLTQALQNASPTPLFIAIDAEGGQVIRLEECYGFEAFPSARELGERDDPTFTRSSAERLARLLAECGINFNFAPVLDLNKNPANPIIAGKHRAFSADTQTVARHAAIFVEAHHRAGILCAGKHFPGHGSSSTDSHHGLVDVTQTWGEDELIPYQHLIANGLLDAVLTAHVCLRQIDPDLPATLSPRVVTGLLRERLGFEGVVFTDDLNMGAIQDHYPLERAVELCVQAGADVVLHANVKHYDPDIARRTVAILRQLVESGRLTEQRIDQSNQRIAALRSRIR
ncbi:MAG TPA: glycoside hydrolase family 3 N-terminal domain-containing protein [Phycisphaerae bacterium]|nr:glycoside hydrolase family 3 N-terminal domain-containing protein [Phycisphaerae bacterium]HOJ72504.1 glycoside hydrolase family 3 N-terminal domain-containing protein [Phycisphaerae bacterium]HOM49835.1 glycoside hydrolase family 3 N-terminal domain-containing protein [Phycisphaerae bacterium]HON65595.1 glycoside hydrolase family 3 N-terminal domain-containing protein [Phycisphaerae bacterium]HOQ84281.1 glycoside hydrolase family 3 N-terminal domain-containing protein [Phycisphaerae bacteri